MEKNKGEQKNFIKVKHIKMWWNISLVYNTEPTETALCIQFIKFSNMRIQNYYNQKWVRFGTLIPISLLVNKVLEVLDREIRQN